MSNQPPRFGRWLLRCILDDHSFDEISGDLEELYHDRILSRGRTIASILYFKDVMLSVRNLHLFRINSAMMTNLVTIAFRSLKKRASYSILNIAGLATSIAFAFLLWLYVDDQTSYDKHVPLADRIYRVDLDADMGGKHDVYANVPQPVAKALRSTYHQVVAAPRVALTDLHANIEYNKNIIRVSNFIVADPEILQLFPREFISGDPSTALTEQWGVIISESMAKAVFGTTDVLGKPMNLPDFGKTLTITGVITDDHRNSHLPIDAIAGWPKDFESEEWYGGHTYTYVLLDEKNDITSLEQQMPAFFDRFMKKTFDEFGGKGKIFFQPLKEIHLAEELIWEPAPHGNATNVLALSIVAVLLLAFAVINYINLATAQAADRALEVSIRKTMGSSRQLLWLQFLCESLLLAMSAAFLSLSIAWFMLPYFNELAGMDFHASWFFTSTHIRSVLMLALAIGVAAGIFPAFYLSSSPANSMKAKFVSSPAGEMLRRILVTTQYFIAALLISGILLVYNQVEFIKNKEIGFDRDNLVNIRVPADSIVNNHVDAYMDAIKTSSAVLSASLARVQLHGDPNSFSPTLQNPDGSTFQSGADIMFVGADFMQTIGAKITAGRPFDKNIKFEEDNSVLINEAAVRKFGWQKDPLNGKFLGFTPYQKRKMNIIGVVDDFHIGVSYELVHPTIIFMSSGSESNLYVRIAGRDTQETLGMIESVWNQHFPNYKMEYSFVDEDLNALYKREDNFLSLLTCFCVVIIFIASLGIIGLISYTTEFRKKEIAIRKVLGSSFRSLVAVLTGKFVMLLMLANLLAIPAAWWLIKLWLNNFAYRADISAIAFAVPFGICMLFTAISIAYHTTRAALANPVDALKCE